MKKCSYCQDRFNWEEGVSLLQIPARIAFTFKYRDMVHKHRWREYRIENYQRCTIKKDIMLIRSK